MLAKWLEAQLIDASYPWYSRVIFNNEMNIFT